MQWQGAGGHCVRSRWQYTVVIVRRIGIDASLEQHLDLVEVALARVLAQLTRRLLHRVSKRAARRNEHARDVRVPLANTVGQRRAVPAVLGVDVSASLDELSYDMPHAFGGRQMEARPAIIVGGVVIEPSVEQHADAHHVRLSRVLTELAARIGILGIEDGALRNQRLRELEVALSDRVCQRRAAPPDRRSHAHAHAVEHNSSHSQ